MVIKKSDDEFELHYFGLKVSGFSDMKEAQYNAPDSTRQVLQILSEFIRDEWTTRPTPDYPNYPETENLEDFE